jgi:kumamolisin
MARKSLKALLGSERKPLEGARSVGKADPTERLEVTVLVRRRGEAALRASVEKLSNAGHGGKEKTAPHRHLKREEFAQQFGAYGNYIEAVRLFAERHGLAVVQEDQPRRTVVLSGSVAQFNEAFDVDLERFEHPGGSYRGRTGLIYLPEELTGIVEAVLGLDDRPQAKPHFRVRSPLGNVQGRTLNAPFTPIELASLYNFPQGTGQGECIGLIELGGGYRPGDLVSYFSELKLPQPQISAVSVDHGKNHPTGSANGPDGEVMLDIEVAGAIAPNAQIVVYFAPNTDAGFLDAITTAIHDTTNRPSVISISWGGPESSWSAQAMKAFDQAFQAAAAMGITICVASGDSGSSDGVNDGANHVDFPASSPFCLACGGTDVHASGRAITSEVVWNDGATGGATGGGVSSVFDLPLWQQGLDSVSTEGQRSPLSKRGVPDVCGDADPNTGYDVLVDGTNTVIGGTSAVAPLWAGLIARINESKGSSVGYVNPKLYQNGAALNDITEGNNGSFSAAPGWDACTGLGSPDGAKVAGIL